MNKKILIVGGVAGGASAAARLRRLDENAEIIMFERGEYISFANCGLPYYIGGEITERDALTLQTPQSFRARFNVDVRAESEVTDIDRSNKIVTVTDRKTGKSYTESYDKLILSPGAEPFLPSIEGISSEKVFTLRNINDTYRIKDYIDETSPESAVVVGGGFIGIEMAENLRSCGADVTVVEMSDQILTTLDHEMSREVALHIKSKGVKIMTNCAVSKIEESKGRLNVTAGDKKLAADMVIMAIGVRPESNLAKQAQLAVNERGAIIVDAHMRTSDENIYAVGDAVEIRDFVTGNPGYVPLAGPANKQGRIAADNICGIPSVYKGTQGSSILKVFDMTAASTGITERTAKRLGIDYEKSYTYSANHASYYPGADMMSIKVIFGRKDGRILGAQIVGREGTDKRCDVFATAIRAGMSASDLTELELCYAPPYGSAKDPVNMAGYVIENILSGKSKIFHWHDIDSIPAEAAKVDVRTPEEYAAGHIPGFINIPLDDIRARADELDISKPVYVTCRIGLRGYIAQRILTAKGYTVYNLSGGSRLADIVRK